MVVSASTLDHAKQHLFGRATHFSGTFHISMTQFFQPVDKGRSNYTGYSTDLIVTKILTKQFLQISKQYCPDATKALPE